MKPIEEAFSSRGFRRVVLPGIVITIGIHPLFRPALAGVVSSYDLPEGAVILVVEVLFWGLLVSSATDWIYYVYEGFRLPWATEPNRRRTEKHLATQTQKVKALLGGKNYQELSPDQQRHILQIYEDLRDFPLRPGVGGAPERYVDRPTRLGNIIATYELYPKTRYHIDGVFYWFHLLGCAPDSAKAEFDAEYAFAESLVITSFSGVVVAALHAVNLIGLLLGTLTGYVVAAAPLSATRSAVLLAFGLLVFVIFYRLALPAHREAGRMFRALVDLSMPKFSEWARTARAPLDVAVIETSAALRGHLDALIARRTG
jgi:hypothetical protein